MAWDSRCETHRRSVNLGGRFGQGPRAGIEPRRQAPPGLENGVLVCAEGVKTSGNLLKLFVRPLAPRKWKSVPGLQSSIGSIYVAV